MQCRVRKCVRECACARACVRACVRGGWGGNERTSEKSVRGTGGTGGGVCKEQRQAERRSAHPTLYSAVRANTKRTGKVMAMLAR